MRTYNYKKIKKEEKEKNKHRFKSKKKEVIYKNGSTGNIEDTEKKLS